MKMSGLNKIYNFLEKKFVQIDLLEVRRFCNNFSNKFSKAFGNILMMS